MSDGSKGAEPHEDEGYTGPNDRRREENRNERKPCGNPRKGNEENQGKIRVIGAELYLALVFHESEVGRSRKGDLEGWDHCSFSIFTWEFHLFC